MIRVKSKEEIEIMKKGGAILADVLGRVVASIRPGVTELEMDELAEKLMRQKGAEPGFKRVAGYRHSICMSTNDVVVHGIPTQYAFRDGDVVGVDCGVFYGGFHTDMSETILVGDASQHHYAQKEKFLATGRKALDAALQVAKEGNRVGHISKTIQGIVEGAGYSVVRSLVGHGVGRQLHEEPEVPGFLVGPIEKTPVLKEGMTMAIEVIYNMGKSDVVYSNDDGWTIATKDGSVSGVFEKTVAITKEGPLILTQ